MSDSHGFVDLATLLGTLPQSTRVIGESSREIASIAIDSRRVTPGALFVALRGEHVDGHRFIAQALAAGAAAIVMEELHDVAAAGATAIVVPDCARALSRIADAFYGSPTGEMTVVGITGTNGKTTTAHMLGAIFNAAGIPAGTIGTIGAHFGGRDWPLENTTPLPHELHALFAQMRDLGARAVAMEVSSHALALARVADVRFRVGALTNVTRDHLDFHKTFDAYARAKRTLFDQAERCVFNADDELGALWARELRGRKSVVTYAQYASADVRAEDVVIRADGSRFVSAGAEFQLRIPGRFNVANALCAIAVARSLEIEDARTAQGLASLENVPGRMEHVHGNGVDVVIDYSHTPDSLENALRSLRETTRGRLIAVFGCGGDRDRGKRPLMGAVAARLADFTFVTSDNPRSEDPRAIADEILPGVGSAPHAVELDRRAAIEAAIASARSGDVVLVAGKGHETYQIVGAKALPFDDAAAARDALARKHPVQP
ncbi:MAG TPA: UDP-N-acetylmuramoyl-L-alanyl-D-glutamate--2,6-diaminopimelate ligase [Candidatus Baltobacteraceae bacterium]|jgi:UDP-N-acetylmuramoyl-L-alanyl-D-glutamate--2,6-diaminopimelate ligase